MAEAPKTCGAPGGNSCCLQRSRIHPKPSKSNGSFLRNARIIPGYHALFVWADLLADSWGIFTGRLHFEKASQPCCPFSGDPMGFGVLGLGFRI